MSTSKLTQEWICLSKEDLQKAIQKAPKFTGAYWQSLNLEKAKGIKCSIINHTEFCLELENSIANRGFFVQKPASVEKFQVGTCTLNSGSSGSDILAGLIYNVIVPGDLNFRFTLGLRNDGSISGSIVQGSPGTDRYGKLKTDGKELLKAESLLLSGRYVEGRTASGEIVHFGFEISGAVHNNQHDPQINFSVTEDRP